MIIDFEDIVILGQQIQALEDDYKEFAEFELAKLLRAAPNCEITLTNSVNVDCCNRGYNFIVKKLRLRKGDNSVFIVGEYCNKEDEVEFFTNIWNFKQMKNIVNQIIF